MTGESTNGRPSTPIVVLAIVGLAFIVVGIGGTAAGWGAKTESSAASAVNPTGGAGTTTTTGSSQTTASTSSAATVAPTTTPPGPTSTSPTATAPSETPESFLAQLASALRTGDTKFLDARLHPAVIERFGEAACIAALPALTDPTAAFTVKSVEKPAPYEWKIGDKSTTVPDTVAVQVTRTRKGQALDVTVHVTLVDGTYRWFTDCSPVTAGANG